MTQRLPKTLEVYLQYHRVEGSTTDTIRYYRKELGLFLRFLEQEGYSMMAPEVTRFDVVAHLDYMKDRGLAPASIQTRCRAIRAFFRWAHEWDVIPANPTEKIKVPRTPKTRKPFLSEDGFRAVLELCPLNTLVGARRQSMFWILATTGMRRREISLLDIQDLDWHKGEIRVIYGKGQKERSVPFMREAQHPVLRYLQQRQDGLPGLWVTEEGRALGYSGIGQDLSRMFERAGVEVQDVCHIFRRTWAANAVRQGIPRPYTQAIAGWASPAMLDRYTVAMEAEQGEIEAFREFNPFGGRGKG